MIINNVISNVSIYKPRRREGRRAMFGKNFGGDLNSTSEIPFEEERSIIIQVETVENIISITNFKILSLDSNKIKELSVTIAFKSQIIAESEIISVPETGDVPISLSGVVLLKNPYPQFLDDILANPVLFTIFDHTTFAKTEFTVINESKKDSKKGMSRASVSVKSGARSSNIMGTANIFGSSNMDLGPLVKGKKLIKETMLLETEKSFCGQNLVSWPKLARIIATASAGEEELIPPNVTASHNIINITLESVYNAPGNIEEGTCFDARIFLPTYGDKMNCYTFSNGLPTKGKDCEFRKRWLSLSHSEPRGVYTKHKVVPDASNIIYSKDEIPELEKFLAENEPRIQWNKWTSTILVKTGSNLFFQKLLKYGVWPIEVFLSPRPASQKTGKMEKRAKTASITSSSAAERYIGYLQLSTLLYPGVTRARVASRLFTFSPSNIAEKCGADFFGGSLSATDAAKSKNEDKMQLTENEPQENKNSFENPLYNENGKPVFIIVEIEVWKPYIPRRETEHFFQSFSSYFPPKGKISKKKMNLRLARDKFAEIVEKFCCVIIESYKCFKVDMKTHDPFCPFDEDNFFNFLCEEEIFQKMKVILEDRIIDLLGETYGDIPEMEEKIPEMFVYLAEDMRRILNGVGLRNKLLKSQVKEADDLQLSAEEAIEEGNYNLARRYLLQKLYGNKLNPDYWLDYAVYLLILQDLEKSMESIREALLLDIQHQMGLLLYGLILTQLKRFRLAELTFQVLLGKYPDFMEGWMILHIFYSKIGYVEGAEFALQTAFRLDREENKKYDLLGEKESGDMAKIISEDESMAKQKSNCCTGSEVYLAEGKYGIASFYKGRSSKDPLGWTQNLGYRYGFQLKTAVLLLRLGCFEFAELALTQSSSSLSEKERNSMEYMYYLAVNHYLRGNYAQAVSHLEVATEKFGKNIFLWSLLGHCYYKSGNYDNAIQCFDYVIESYNRPDDIHLIYIRMAIYYMKTKSYKCAKKMFLSACKYSPSSETWLGLGAACYNLEEFEMAEAALKEANFLDSTCPVVWAYLTLVNIQLQRYDVFALCYAQTKKKNLSDSDLIKQIEILMEVHRLNLPR